MRHTALMLMRVFLLLTTLCVAAGLAGAQMQMNGKAAQTGPFRSTQKALQMRQMTTARRKAAATRNRQRKVAAGQRNQVIQRKANGVAR